MGAKDLELHTLPGLIEDATKSRTQVAELREAATEDEMNVTVTDDLRKEVSAVKIDVAELLPAVVKSRDLWIDTEKETRWAEMELSLVNNREK